MGLTVAVKDALEIPDTMFEILRDWPVAELRIVRPPVAYCC